MISYIVEKKLGTFAALMSFMMIVRLSEPVKSNQVRVSGCRNSK